MPGTLAIFYSINLILRQQEKDAVTLAHVIVTGGELAFSTIIYSTA